MRISKNGRISALKVAASVGLLGAAAVHYALVPEHFREWLAAGWFFVALATFEAFYRDRPLARPFAEALGSGHCHERRDHIAVGTLSNQRVAFRPGPWRPEAVGLPDAASTLLEAMTAGALVALYWSGTGSKIPGDRPAEASSEEPA